MFGYNLDVINRSTSVARYSWLLNRKFKPRKFLHCAHNIVSEKIVGRRGRDTQKMAEGHTLYSPGLKEFSTARGTLKTAVNSLTLPLWYYQVDISDFHNRK